MNLIWLRNDLRLHDHPGFQLAQQQQQPVAVVYILPHSWLQPAELSLNRLAKAKARFLRACLIDLHRNLYLQNIPLQILYGDPVDLLSQWHQQQPFQLLTHSPQAPEESDWLQAIEQQGISTTTYDNQTLFSATQMAPLLSDWPASFSQFRRHVEKQLTVDISAAQKPVHLTNTGIEAPYITHVPWPTDFSSADNVRSFHLNGGESAGENWLTHYLWQSQSIRHYKDTRNQLVGQEYSSQLSAYLAWGCLSARKVWHAITAFEAVHGEDEHSYWLRFELLWREYFHWSMRVHGKRCFFYSALSGESLSAPALKTSHCSSWQAASTGMPVIDAGLRELKQTGFTSNRMRQWLASYFINELALDWRLGAQFFERYLIDYDVASNWGNWAYLAGVGHDPRGKPGAGRYFDLNKQLRRYDPQLSHIQQWLPELAECSVDDICAHQNGTTILANYPAPVQSLRS
ncbi:deoxyribodipyrimidine photolyase [Bacterioplanes sanyensis]|uniref:Cryptochrome DASH n=1 Tax=Bacterioplanes sanyensis TaxID=1249553 RepID=A0A222FEY8_9GAMM|nr:DASH family cryptochrome [Bacterioplanes sanyensis]ASP37319.1 deoxyribodipyrimidine photolyase [Bacterioplanes sanyensis]